MRSHSLLAVATNALAVFVGCGFGQRAPLVDPNQFPTALLGIEEGVEKTIAAIESGDPKAADGPLHTMPRLIGIAKRLAEPAGLTKDQSTGLVAALGDLNEVFGELHGPVHKGVLPEDFDFEPYRDKLQAGLRAMRNALPTGVVGFLQEKRELREAARASDATADEPAATVTPAPQAPLPPFTPDEPAPSDTPSPDSLDPDAMLETAPPEAGAALPTPPARIAAGRRGVAPLCPSVMLWDDESYELAPERINRVAELLEGVPPDRRWVQLVPTLHARLNADLTIAEYGTMIDRSESWTDADNFRPATGALADRLRERFAATIRQAVHRGLHVSILPHLDPAGGPIAEWRNLYDFAPDQVIGAGSYESLLLGPLANAIEAEATSDTRFDFALSGEMGRSLFTHPSDYFGLQTQLRQRFSAQSSTDGIRIGIALNWSGLAGGVEPASIDRPRVAALFADFDFLAFSCYAPVSVGPSKSDFVEAIEAFFDELTELAGEAIDRGTVTLAESGIGGGHASVEQTAAQPYAGNGNPASDPWADDLLRSLRGEYHAALCDCLAAENLTRVEKAFLWSEGPWDPQGVADRRFRDEEIAKLIAEHNKTPRPETSP